MANNINITSLGYPLSLKFIDLLHQVYLTIILLVHVCGWSVEFVTINKSIMILGAASFWSWNYSATMLGQNIHSISWFQILSISAPICMGIDWYFLVDPTVHMTFIGHFALCAFLLLSKTIQNDLTDAGSILYCAGVGFPPWIHAPCLHISYEYGFLQYIYGYYMTIPTDSGIFSGSFRMMLNAYWKSLNLKSVHGSCW